MTEIFTIISCFYFFGTGTAVPNHCSPDFYDSAFQSMEACEKKRKESFVYDDKRIPSTKGSMDTAGADVWNICVPKAEFERHLRRDKFGNLFVSQRRRSLTTPVSWTLRSFVKPIEIIFHCMSSSFLDLHFSLNAWQRFFVSHGCISIYAL
jgi:hypothetical protein